MLKKTYVLLIALASFAFVSASEIKPKQKIIRIIIKDEPREYQEVKIYNKKFIVYFEKLETNIKIIKKYVHINHNKITRVPKSNYEYHYTKLNLTSGNEYTIMEPYTTLPKEIKKTIFENTEVQKYFKKNRNRRKHIPNDNNKV